MFPLPIFCRFWWFFVFLRGGPGSVACVSLSFLRAFSPLLPLFSSLLLPSVSSSSCCRVCASCALSLLPFAPCSSRWSLSVLLSFVLSSCSFLFSFLRFSGGRGFRLGCLFPSVCRCLLSSCFVGCPFVGSPRVLFPALRVCRSASARFFRSFPLSLCARFSLVSCLWFFSWLFVCGFFSCFFVLVFFPFVFSCRRGCCSLHRPLGLCCCCVSFLGWSSFFGWLFCSGGFLPCLFLCFLCFLAFLARSSALLAGWLFVFVLCAAFFFAPPDLNGCFQC